MLKNSLPIYQIPRVEDLSVPPDLEIDLILSFIDKHAPSFPSFYLQQKDSVKENRITDILVRHFQLCKIEQLGGFLPFDFSKNPTQSESDKEADIGVFPLSRSRKQIPIIEFEAKRFSKSSNNKEYVCGLRGGIERFKRGHHSPNLKICGMFGYVQSENSLAWLEKVNNWIKELSDNNIDQTIDWTNSEEKLTKIVSFPHVEKYFSTHVRMQSKDKISLWHYLIELFDPI